MKISLKWLIDYVDVSSYLNRPEELAEILTRAGLEVEQIMDRRREFRQVVVGLILEKTQHPNADKLSLCRVTTGEGVVHQIVCGAQNHRANDRVIVALPGAILPGNFAIKQSVIRGVESGGMLCSYRELGMADTSEGIAILPENAPIGQAYATYVGMDDVIFELKVTPNRADCLSHFGLARELGCLLQKDVKSPMAMGSSPSVKIDLNGKLAGDLQIQIQSPDMCPRYTGRVIQGVKVGPSPEWLQQRLQAVGLNSINNIVDVTNYVMMEMGQPLHAFDLTKIRGGRLQIGKANPEEKFILLDGQEKVLKGQELMIRDGESSLCMAGVMGGLNSGVTSATTSVFLESAYFLPMAVRKASRTHGIESDSAYRFSRGVDPEGALRASERAAFLICEVAGGEALPQVFDFYPVPVSKEWISLSVSRVSERLGYAADAGQFLDYMKRLGCRVEEESEPIGEKKLRILPPTYRFDIEMDMDLVEEYARLHGYEHIPEALPALKMQPSAHDKDYLFRQSVAQVWKAAGYHQAVHFAFGSLRAEAELLGSSPESLNTYRQCGLEISEEPIQLLNPLNADLDGMRRTLVLGLMETMVSNFHYGNEIGRIFELGSTFGKNIQGEYCEYLRGGFIAWGQGKDLWQKHLQQPLIFEAKAAVEVFLRALNLNNFSWAAVKKAELEIPGFLHRGQFGHLVWEGKKVGYIGAIHPGILANRKVRVPVVVGEVNLGLLKNSWPRPLRIASLSKMPMVERDLALIMPKSMPVGEVLRVLRKTLGSVLMQTQIFDLYQGDNIAADKKSVGVRLLLQEASGTLAESRLLEIQDLALAALQKELGVGVR